MGRCLSGLRFTMESKIRKPYRKAAPNFETGGLTEDLCVYSLFSSSCCLEHKRTPTHRHHWEGRLSLLLAPVLFLFFPYVCFDRTRSIPGFCITNHIQLSIRDKASQEHVISLMQSQFFLNFARNGCNSPGFLRKGKLRATMRRTLRAISETRQNMYKSWGRIRTESK